MDAPCGGYAVLREPGFCRAVSGQPRPIGVCDWCQGQIRLGSILLRVEITHDPPGDAVAADGPEWLASLRFAESLRRLAPGYAEYYPVAGPDGSEVPFMQVALLQTIRAAQRSVKGGSKCARCGGHVQVDLSPLHILAPEECPPIACLLESRGVVLVRQDIAAAVTREGMDVGFVDAICVRE